MVKHKHLAAIIFTDLVGFSKIANTNEAKALELIEINRHHQKPIIKKYGSFVKEIGDGILAKFTSAFDAVACSIEIQNSTPPALLNKIRIGIHLGDITEENGDVFGDGVNLASRLESIAAPGAIYISDSVYNAIKSIDDIKTEYLGDKELKNIADSVKCYKVLGVKLGATLKPSKRPAFNSRLMTFLLLVVMVVVTVLIVTNRNNTKDIPMITVLPFKQLEGDTSDLFLEKGMTEELIRSLGKNTSLIVINPKSTLRYFATINPFEEASSELEESDYFVKGYYSKKINIIDINLTLLDRSNKEIWSGNYGKDEAYIPEMISNITIDISEALDANLSQAKQERMKEIKNIDPETYRLYLKGMTIINTYNVSDYPKGIMYLEEAVDRNTADSKAWAGLAEGYVWLGHSPIGPPYAWHKAKAAAIRAIQLDSMNAEAYAALAHVKTYFEYDYKEAEIGYKKANQLNPSMAFNHYHYAWHLYLFDSLDKAIEEHKIAQKLDPFAPVHTFWLGGLLVFRGDMEEAKKEIKKAFAIEPDLPVAYSILGDIYRREGKYDSAEYAFKKSIELAPFIKYLMYMKHCFRVGDYDKGFQILEEAKMVLPQGSFSSFVLAGAYAEIDSADQFFKYANYEPANAFVPWFRKGVSSKVIIEDPRFKQLMDKMNLPMPATTSDNY